MSRALAVARAEVPALAAVRLRADGSLEGFESLGPDRGPGAGVVVVAQVLGLLVTFIGEPLTLRLVRDAWPDLPAAEPVAGRGEGS